MISNNPNARIEEFTLADKVTKVKLATGEVLKTAETTESKEIPLIILYAWESEESALIFTKNPTPTTDNKALTALDALAGLEPITDTEEDTITVLSTVYTRNSNEDIELD